MEVAQEPFLEHGESTGQGTYDYWYEGTDTTFSFGGGRTLRARRYTDEPERAFLHFSWQGPHEGEAELLAAAAWLRNAGVSQIMVLGGPNGGYRPMGEP